MAYGNQISRQFYYSCPPIAKNIITSVYGLRERKSRYGAWFRQFRELLFKSQYWSMTDLEEYQHFRLNGYVKRVLESTPYYRDRYGVTASLQDIGILSKKDAKMNLGMLQPENLKSIRHRRVHTSGTTGSSMIFPVSLECFQREYAFRALHHSWGGIDREPGEKVAICAGHPVTSPERDRQPFWTYDWANKWLIFSSYHMSSLNLRWYIQELERFRPAMITGYPSSLYLLALAYRKFGGTPLNLRSAFCGSETLYPFQREVIEGAFGVKLFNWYGNTEMCCNIVECEKGEMHLKLEHSFVEILDGKNKPCGPGETGRLVCSGFGNDAFSLLRYDVGDHVTIALNQKSTCGRGGLLIDRIDGRSEDYVVTADGRLVGRLDHLFKDSINVVEAQIEQTNLNEVLLRIVPTNSYTSVDERSIAAAARIRLGPSIMVRFDYVKSIPRTANGKFRFVLGNPELIRSTNNLY